MVQAEVIGKYRLQITPDRAIEADLMDIPLDLLTLDPENPRLRHIGSEIEGKSSAEIAKILWEHENFRNEIRELYRQIRYSRGLQEAPLVISYNGKYLVKEGNLRVACLLRLREDVSKEKKSVRDIKLENIDPVRCVTLPPETTRKEIGIYLTRIHVVGKTEWDAIDQAAQVYNLYNRDGLTFDEIAASCGIGKATAQRMEKGYKETMEYVQETPSDHLGIRRYSYFYELHKLTKKMPDGWIDTNIKQFMNWLKNGQFERGAQVRDLPKVVNDAEALKVLMDGAEFTKALEVVGNKDVTMSSDYFKKLGQAVKVLDQFPESEYDECVKNPRKLDYLKNSLLARVQSIISTIEKRKTVAG
jgi:hypothetical protein